MERGFQREGMHGQGTEWTKVTINIGHTNWVDRHAPISSTLKRKKTPNRILNELG